jgi:hypothetical protein
VLKTIDLRGNGIIGEIRDEIKSVCGSNGIQAEGVITAEDNNPHEHVLIPIRRTMLINPS